MIGTSTDLDLLTAIMRAKQNLVFSERQLDAGKATLNQTPEFLAVVSYKEQKKKAKAELGELIDRLEPHIQGRRDDLSFPKFPGFGDTTLGEKGAQ
jgi:hypothetical protein